MNPNIGEAKRLAATPWPTRDLEAVHMCPVCGSAERVELYENLSDTTAFAAPGRWTLWRCGACRSAYLNPRPTRGSIGRAYETYYTHSEDAGQAEQRPNGSFAKLKFKLANGYRNHRFGTHMRPSSSLGSYVGRMLPMVRRSSDYHFRYLPWTNDPHPRLLDIGCGDGRWLASVSESRWALHGADPDPRAVARAHSKGLDVREGGFEAWYDEPGSFDAITMSHVIEHVHDPREVLTQMLRLLKPGGQLYVETPNIDALGHRWFKRSWRGLEPPRHLALFNAASLISTLQEVGFRKVKQRSAPSPLNFIIAVSTDLRMLETPDHLDPLPSDIAQRWYKLRTKWTKKRAEFLFMTCERPQSR